MGFAEWSCCTSTGRLFTRFSMRNTPLSGLNHCYLGLGYLRGQTSIVPNACSAGRQPCPIRVLLHWGNLSDSAVLRHLDFSLFKQGESSNSSWVRTKYIRSPAPLTSHCAEDPQDTGKELITGSSPNAAPNISLIFKKNVIETASLPGTRKAACLAPQSLHICHPTFCSQEIIIFPGTTGERWGGKKPPQATGIPTASGAPGPCPPAPRPLPRLSRSGKEAKAGTLAQVCSVTCKEPQV